MEKRWFSLVLLLNMVLLTGCVEDSLSAKSSVVAPGAKVEKLAGGFRFTEGPAADAQGNIFFTDIPNNRIHKWSLDAKLTTFLENSGGANGLFFDKDGNMLACLGNAGQLVSISPDGTVTVLTGKFQGKSFNSPNDLWLHPGGMIYFTDPRYGPKDHLPQDGEHLYCFFIDGQRVKRVLDDMVRPNGVVGTRDGKILYVADHGAGTIYAYTIKSEGTLSKKRVFAPEASDGMTVDSEGNVYLTTDVVSVYDAKGNQIETIEVPERPANVCFGGSDKQTLFITARTSLYSISMRVKGQ